MEYVLYNEELKRFCVLTETDKIHKSPFIERAYKFDSGNQARKKRSTATRKLFGYHVYGILEDGSIFKVKKSNRKQFSMSERLEVYNKYNGYCYLCGRKLDFSEFEIEHIIPLNRGGTNNFNNLGCSCHMCNRIKQNIDPQDFLERIADIYMYQIEKKIANSFKWKIVHKLLVNLI